MTLDVDRIRSHFPSLEDGTAFFDGPGGTQVPRPVGRAVADALTGGLSNRGTVTASELRAEACVTGARSAVADLLGCARDGVVFARSMTQATYDVARTLAQGWGPDDEVVVTRLDHDANIRPWVHAAETAGATVRWVSFDRETAELPVDAVAAELSERTRLVAVTAASNLLGTRPDIPAIVEAAREVGAQVYVDGVHLTPHAPVDVSALGADFYACSPYKFLGPHHGVVVADPTTWEALRPAKLLPSSDAVPERFELGTLPYELLAGTTAAIDFLADLDPTTASGSDRRSRILASMSALETHEAALFDRLAEGLSAIEGVRLHGAPKRATPTALFSVAGRSGREIYEGLAEAGINAPASHFYAIEASRWIGLGDEGAVRAGIAPYTSAEDVGRLVERVAELAR